MNSTNSFEDRKHKLFASLETAELQIADGSILEQKPYEKEDALHSVKKQKLNTMMKHNGKESIFKRPNLPITRCLPSKRVPDYQKNPHKWKKYSLEDVSTSEGANKAAAFEFLNRIEEEKRNKRLEAMQDDQDMPNIVPFISKRGVSFNKSATHLKTTSKSYDVDGGGNAVEPRKKSKGSKTTNTVKLDHLFDE